MPATEPGARRRVIEFPSWRFCPIERYTLSRSGANKLAGTYRSTECHDDAEITLER